MAGQDPTSPPRHQERVENILNLQFGDRKALSTGPRIKLYDGDRFVREIPRALFLAATTEPQLVQKASDEIRLPHDTGPQPIRYVADWLIGVGEKTKPTTLRQQYSMLPDLLICRVGCLLGLETYTAHVHNNYWWRLSNRPFNPIDIEIVLHAAADNIDDSFLYLISRQIAECLLDRSGSEPAKLQAYVESKPMLARVVYKARIDILDEAQHSWEEWKAMTAERQEATVGV